MEEVFKNQSIKSSGSLKNLKLFFKRDFDCDEFLKLKLANKVKH